MLIDASGRIIDYLRLSVTDRCNFRCLYCHPPAGVTLRPASRLLQADEFVRIARVATGLGVRKIRLTGGEPLLHPDIVPLVGRLAPLPGLQDLAATTNGSRLGALARPLRQAGLRGVNLSIDSLRADRFARISRGGDLQETLDAFREARAAGLDVKINTVALEGWNTDELPDFVRFAEEHDVEVRFIEFMPLSGQGWSPDLFVSAWEIHRRLREQFALRPLEPTGVATRFATDSGARIGFIPTISEPFCDGCRRMRLTAWGALRPCLFSGCEIDLRPLLADDDGDDALRAAFVRAARAKPERNPVLFADEDPRALRIRSIGG
jgi:cyclic pyranopterin phosphate synthase